MTSGTDTPTAEAGAQANCISMTIVAPVTFTVPAWSPGSTYTDQASARTNPLLAGRLGAGGDRIVHSTNSEKGEILVNLVRRPKASLLPETQTPSRKGAGK